MFTAAANALATDLDWARRYGAPEDPQELAEGLTETPPQLETALDLVRGFWAAALTNANIRPGQKA